MDKERKLAERVFQNVFKGRRLIYEVSYIEEHIIEVAKLLSSKAERYIFYDELQKLFTTGADGERYRQERKYDRVTFPFGEEEIHRLCQWVANQQHSEQSREKVVKIPQLYFRWIGDLEKLNRLYIALRGHYITDDTSHDTFSKLFLPEKDNENTPGIKWLILNARQPNKKSVYDLIRILSSSDHELIEFTGNEVAKQMILEHHFRDSTGGSLGKFRSANSDGKSSHYNLLLQIIKGL